MSETKSLFHGRIGWFEQTQTTLAENLALDEAMLEAVNECPEVGFLRFWESSQIGVVLGRSNRVDAEVNVSVCQEKSIPILRRPSGGGTVVLGPCCLAFSLALPLREEHRTLGVSCVAQSLMQVIADGLRKVVPTVCVLGTSDLTVSGLKFSGNAQRWLKSAFLHHGTILYDFDMSLVSELLKQPARQPEYRAGRQHADFISNIAVKREDLKNSLIEAWRAEQIPCPTAMQIRANNIADERYSDPEWMVLK